MLRVCKDIQCNIVLENLLHLIFVAADPCYTLCYF